MKTVAVKFIRSSIASLIDKTSAIMLVICKSFRTCVALYWTWWYRILAIQFISWLVLYCIGYSTNWQMTKPILQNTPKFFHLCNKWYCNCNCKVSNVYAERFMFYSNLLIKWFDFIIAFKKFSVSFKLCDLVLLSFYE